MLIPRYSIHLDLVLVVDVAGGTGGHAIFEPQFDIEEIELETRDHVGDECQCDLSSGSR